MINLTAVKKLQSPANLRSSPNSLVLGDQTLPTQYDMETKPLHGDTQFIELIRYSSTVQFALEWRTGVRQPPSSFRHSILENIAAFAA